MRNNRNIFLSVIFVLLQLSCASDTEAQDIGFAKDLYVHNLKARALELFIEIYHNAKSSASNKAEALYYMGQISFEDSRN